MARTTDPSLRNSTIYSVFIRNHSPSGDFTGLIKDLPRIAELGCNVLWLMPIHPIGTEKRKGGAGSPYAISDYRGINPEYGTMDDFASFIKEAHKLNLKVIIDVVFNHTSPDSLLSKVQPEWFWRDPKGRFGNRVGDWSDVIDLDYSDPELWDYQIETLKGWLREGVDGFRCDVAPLLPLAFWIDARAMGDTVNPEALWLAETVEGDFISMIRRSGFECLTDAETLRAFDLSYEYDTYPDWIRLLDDNIGLAAYVDRLRIQESTLNDTDLKLRFLENHDQPRAAELLGSGTKSLRQWTAYSLFAKGAGMVYAGQEYGLAHKPNLFDPDPVNWPSADDQQAAENFQFISSLINLKKEGVIRDGFYWLPEGPEGCIAAAYERRNIEGRLTGLRLGVFNVQGEAGAALNCKALWPELGDDEVLRDRLADTELKLNSGSLNIAGEPLILDWGITS